MCVSVERRRNKRWQIIGLVMSVRHELFNLCPIPNQYFNDNCCAPFGIYFDYNTCECNMCARACAHSFRESCERNQKKKQNHCHNNYKYDDCGCMYFASQHIRAVHKYVCSHMLLNIAHERLTATTGTVYINRGAWTWTYLIDNVDIVSRRYSYIRRYGIDNAMCLTHIAHTFYSRIHGVHSNIIGIDCEAMK